MKSFVKTVLIGCVAAFALVGCNDGKNNDNFSKLSQKEQESYAMGASFSTYVKHSLDAQHVDLDPKYLTEGFSDAYLGKNKISDAQMNEIITSLGKRVQKENKDRIAKEAKTSREEGAQYQEKFLKEKNAQKTASGLIYKIINPGEGKHPTMNSTVVVNYTGKLVNGQEFDSSYSRNAPATFPLGYVIKGWSEGLQLIGTGGEIELVVPPELAYGDQSLPAHDEGKVAVPSQSTLVFKIKLLKIEKANVSSGKSMSSGNIQSS